MLREAMLHANPHLAATFERMIAALEGDGCTVAEAREGMDTPPRTLKDYIGPAREPGEEG